MIARALGEFVARRGRRAPRSRTIVDKGDPSYFVEAEACLALGKTRTPRAGELLRKAATRESFTDVIRQHAYRGLAEARDDSALGLLVDGIALGPPDAGPPRRRRRARAAHARPPRSRGARRARADRAAARRPRLPRAGRGDRGARA